MAFAVALVLGGAGCHRRLSNPAASPSVVALLGERYRPLTVLFIGWFGPRGLATIVFAILGLEAMHGSSIPTELVGATFAWTVLLSVVLHGLSAAPLAAWYGRRIHEGAPGIPELADGPGEPEAVTTPA